MKKLLLLLSLSYIITSCSYSLYREDSYIGDFRYYTSNNFVVSVTSTGYSYSPIADITIDFVIGAEYDIQAAKKRDFVKRYGIKNVGSMIEDKFHPSYDYMLAALVYKAQLMEATGLLNLKVIPHYKYTSSSLGSLYIDRYTISGFAVKIKEGETYDATAQDGAQQ